MQFSNECADSVTFCKVWELQMKTNIPDTQYGNFYKRVMKTQFCARAKFLFD